MAAMALFCCSPISCNPRNPNLVSTFSSQFSKTKLLNPNFGPTFHTPCAGGDGGSNVGGGSGGDGGWSDDGGDSDSNKSKFSWERFGAIGGLVNGWRERVAADAEFPFKVVMEELVGVTACIVGDMASRPNYGLNELDFVFSTLVVGSILNFFLMYVLAPTSASSIQKLPSVFAGSPASHMFEPGSYTLVQRMGTLVYKGAVFASVGFAAGLVGTAISNGLILARKKVDKSFETPNKPPPTLLNASAWALQLGISSNVRYQCLNGVEFVLAKVAPPYVFKSSVVVLRCLNNVVGGMSLYGQVDWLSNCKLTFSSINLSHHLLHIFVFL